MLQFELNKRFSTFSLSIAAAIDREWLALLAPSGGGKSLTLNLIAGMVRPDGGLIRLNGQTLYDGARGLHLPIRRRRIGYVFQNYALFPHLSVGENVAYGLPRGVDRAAEVHHWLRLFHLEGREEALPRQLSGGQQQRVALARALASRPQLLLLDEPFSALDRRTRENLQRELAGLKEKLSIPVILVTHDFAEARLLGDLVAVLQDGRVMEMDRTDVLFARPKRHQTARFLGVENVLPVRVVQAGPGATCLVRHGSVTLRTTDHQGLAAGQEAHLCIRAADLLLAPAGSSQPGLTARVTRLLQAEDGLRWLIHLNLEDGEELVAAADQEAMRRLAITVGSRVRAWPAPERAFLCAP